MSHQKILILDFGSQVAQLIARRVREQQVYCELHPFDVSDDFIREFKPQGIILSGGPNSVYEALEWKAPQVVFELGVPVLGICFGMQMAVIEAARDLVGIKSAGSTEFGPSDEPVVGLMTEWMRGNELEKRKAKRVQRKTKRDRAGRVNSHRNSGRSGKKQRWSGDKRRQSQLVAA